MTNNKSQLLHIEQNAECKYMSILIDGIAITRPNYKIICLLTAKQVKNKNLLAKTYHFNLL